MRHATHAAIRPVLMILFVVCAISCGSRSVKIGFSPALVNAQGRPSLGYLEHRGEMFDLRDWSSSVYDADESDKTLAHPILLPTIAGIGFYSVTLGSYTAHVDGETHVVMFEEPVEDQCVEITITD